VISVTFVLTAFHADPAICVQLDQCATYGIAAALETFSLRFAAAKGCKIICPFRHVWHLSSAEYGLT
jgi:hypothetical protein